MTKDPDETQPAMTYPTVRQYEQWKDAAEEMDMSVSEFMASMIEAGRKKFEINIAPDETNTELRRQRNDIKRELEHARERIETLEDQLHKTERDEIEEFVTENPGATYDEIIRRIGKTVPDRVMVHLDDMAGSSIHYEDDAYYPVEDAE